MFVIPPPYPLWFIPPLGFPSPSLLNTNEFLETLMLLDSRGLTRNTDHLWALLRTNTWPSFSQASAWKRNFCSPALFYSSIPDGARGNRHFLYARVKVKKPFFFLSFAREVLCFVFSCNISFPLTKDTQCLEILLIFMKNVSLCVGLMRGGF